MHGSALVSVNAPLVSPTERQSVFSKLVSLLPVVLVPMNRRGTYHVHSGRKQSVTLDGPAMARTALPRGCLSRSFAMYCRRGYHFTFLSTRSYVYLQAVT